MLLTEYNEAETLELFKSDYLAEGWAKGRTKGTETEHLNSIRSIMDSLNVSSREAMTILKIPVAEQMKYIDRIQ